MADSSELKCGFCSLPSTKVKKLVKGVGDTCICNNCIFEAYDVVEEALAAEDAGTKHSKKIDRPTPKQIVEHLNQYVIGQDEAKKILAVSVYNHYKRIGKGSKTDLAKSNVLMVGPTGSGKTYLVETIAKFLQVPFASADATSMTEAGYVGDDVESVLVRLVQNCEGDIQKAERGIVYIDEIDKIAVKDSRGRDISGEGVQQGLLKMLEGSLVTINPQGKKNSQGPQETINTKNILFICGGAFSGLTDLSQKPKTLGIGATGEQEKIKKLRHRDLVKFGMIPEFCGRFPLIAQLEALKKEDLVKILTEPKNSLVKQYQELLGDDGKNLTFTDEFLMEVAARASKEGTGARGLRAILEPILMDIMFEAPDSKDGSIQITPDMIKKNENE